MVRRVLDLLVDDMNFENLCYCGEFREYCMHEDFEPSTIAVREKNRIRYQDEISNAVAVLDAYHVPVEKLRLGYRSKTGLSRGVETSEDMYVHVLDVLELIKALA